MTTARAYAFACLALVSTVGLLAAALDGSAAGPERDPRLSLTNRGATGAASRTGGRPADVLVSAPIVQAAPTSTIELSKSANLGLFKVTGYSDSPRNGTDGRGITRSGQPTRWGVVAVDPQVIHLGSRILIAGFPRTIFDCLDTGGGVRGRHVDVWFPSDADALKHGVQRRTVELIEDPN